MKPSKTQLSLKDEKELVERLQRGDTAALTPLWDAHAQHLYAAVIFPRLPVRDLAEEVLQNTFLKAYERIGKYTWQERGISPWLNTLARNLITDVHRKNQRTERFCKGYSNHLDTLTSTPQRPDQTLQKHQELTLLQERVRCVLDHPKLNERYRKVIEMRIFQELDREAVAHELGVRVGTLDVLFHRALKRVETLYNELYPPTST